MPSRSVTHPVLVLRLSAKYMRDMIWITAAVMAAMTVFLFFVERWLVFLPPLMWLVFAAAFKLGAIRREANPEPRLTIDRNGIRFGPDSAALIPWSEIVRTRFFAGLVDAQPGLRFAVEVRDRERTRAAFDAYDNTMAAVKGIPEVSLPIAELDGTADDIRAIIFHYRPNLAPAI